MPISLSELRSKTKKGSLYGGKLNFEYRLHGEGLDRLAEQLDAADDEDKGVMLSANLDVFCGTLVSWDLIGDDDRPVPLTPDAIRAAQVPWDVITDIMTHVGENRNPQSRGRKR